MEGAEIGRAKQKREGVERESGMETMSTMDEAASTSDG